MSSTNKTSYIVLSQYILSDKRKMADYNADMLAIDNHLIALRDGTKTVAKATTATKADTVKTAGGTYSAAGTAAFMNVPGTVGVAAAITEVVRGDDPRLTDERSAPNGSITDTKLGNRTISDATAPTSDAGVLTDLLGFLANMIKQITGAANWRTAPAMTIATLSGKFNASTGHAHTGAANDAPQLQAAGLADGAASDAKIGNRTIGDTTVPSADSAQLGTLLSNLANRIKSITGETTWRTTNTDTLKTLRTAVDAKQATITLAANMAMITDASGKPAAHGSVTGADLTSMKNVANGTTKIHAVFTA